MRKRSIFLIALFIVLAAGMFILNYSNVNDNNPYSKSNMDGSGLSFYSAKEQIITENITPKNRKLVIDFFVSSSLKDLKEVLYFNPLTRLINTVKSLSASIFLKNLSFLN